MSEGKRDVIDEICAPKYRLYATLSGPDAIDRDQLKETRSVLAFLVRWRPCRDR